VANKCGQKGRGRPGKAYIEEMIRQTDCNQYREHRKTGLNKKEIIKFAIY